MTTSTAAHRRQEAASAYLAELATCPGHQVLGILAGKWTTLLVEALADGPVRYGELRRRVAGASPKMLTQTLRELQRDGIVRREVVPTAPVQVEYSLTPLGERFLDLQRHVRAWAHTHAADIARARRRWDAGAS
ncbi:helix-turn-helix domain-containing protein [Actinomycetospora lutea]|uniref:winged helix-turn-helix transcriptional regulator n=1 Tax=Actinomycetospora lutea TaxID=663604 RepID=UPI002365CC64|nr:helix-turn-helix domain-containing protein [Actinomycetospora lutea]MDD7939089.1 helix-turn-helix domain-containing protein [Actinomycetospora lutea]